VYGFAYHRLEDVIGQYAAIVGLLPVAASGMAWGLAAGIATGLVGFALVRVLSAGTISPVWSTSTSVS
jgi:hypothetical protein